LFVFKKLVVFACLGAIGLSFDGSAHAATLSPYQQGKGYTYVQGLAPEKELNPTDLQIRIGTWNICGTHLSQIYGGVIHWQHRLPGIIQIVQETDPDVMVFQEVYDKELIDALVLGLQDRYPHFFVHLGPNPEGAEGGCMVLSKCPIHSFSNISFANNGPLLNRGFATLEIKAKREDIAPCLRIIGSHVAYGYKAQEIQKRERQIEQIKTHITSLAPFPTLIAADFNIEREDPLLSFLQHGYKGKEPTCMTTGLLKKWDSHAQGPDEEWIDNISLLQGSKGTIEAHLVHGFNPITLDTQTALSDHHLLIGTYTCSASKEPE